MFQFHYYYFPNVAGYSTLPEGFRFISNSYDRISWENQEMPSKQKK